MQQKIEEWDSVIQPKSKWYELHWKEILGHKDLLFLLVKRDFVSVYKQTVLGPLWFFIQPVFTALTFTVIFGNVAQISTEGSPKILFYLAGITLWNYFSGCLTRTSSIFITNQHLFGKVYFPRLIIPLSLIITNLFKLGIQFLLFLVFWIYYYATTNTISVNVTILLLPILIIIMAALGLGLGMIISSMTTKYRDLTFLIGFGVQLLMYACPIIYPLSAVPYKFHWLLKVNPMTSIVTTFKHAFLGVEQFDLGGLLYSIVFSIVILTLGIGVFNKVEKNFIDTV